MTLTAARVDDRYVELSWADGSCSRFHHMWLRDNCPELRHATTNHRVAETSEIPGDVRPETVTIDAAGTTALVVTWQHDGHVSTFPAPWLRAHDYSRGVTHERRAVQLWDASIGGDMPRARWPELTDDPRVRAAFLGGFIDHGVGLLHDVPCVPGTVLEVAAFFGEVRTTSWGTVFDVISMEDANSVAYTNLPLVTHTDEGYRDPAPTVQLQHFLRADASGGESTLVDGFAVAEHLRSTEPAMFDALSRTMLRFHFADATAEHEAVGPVITLHPDGRIRAIRYSNHSALPFLLPFDEMEAFYTAYREFGRLRESDRFQYRVDMRAGDLYMVDNHRVMHGRTGFSSGGARHLQSCYIERDELESRLTVLRRTL